jgi:hypothetical protein
MALPRDSFRHSFLTPLIHNISVIVDPLWCPPIKNIKNGDIFLQKMLSQLCASLLTMAEVEVIRRKRWCSRRASEIRINLSRLQRLFKQMFWNSSSDVLTDYLYTLIQTTFILLTVLMTLIHPVKCSDNSYSAIIIIIIIMALQFFVGSGPHFSVSWSYTQSVGLLERGISPSQGLYLHTKQHKHRIKAHNTDNHSLSGFRTHDPRVRTSEESSCLTALPLWSVRWQHTIQN